MQNIEFFLVFQFDVLSNLEGLAERTLEDETAGYIEAALEKVHPGENVTVLAFVKEQSVLSSAIKPDTRNLRNDVNRVLQDDGTGLEVSLKITVSVRSANTYDTETLHKSTATAFNTTEKRKKFLENLQTKDTTFNKINEIEVTVNNELVLIPQSTVAWAYIGAGIGAAILAIVSFLFIGYRRRNRNMHPLNAPEPNPLGPNPYFEVSEMDDNDVSTMGPPDVGGQTMFGHFGQEDDAQNESTLSSGYDYKMRYGGAGYVPSVSTAGGNKSAYGPYALADDLTLDDQSTHRMRIDSEDVSNVSNNEEDLSLFQEDDSFDQQYGEDERIDVIAPPGKLGVVIDNPTNSVPMVHAIKETSVLADRVRIGDKLVLVDGQDTTEMTAIGVSKLISSKAMNTRRHMVFMRSASPN
jgi:hypothetical protein